MSNMKTMEEIDKIYDEMLPPGTLFNEADKIISVENISKATGLSLETIENIAKTITT